MLNEGSSGLKETRLSASRIPIVRTSKPMNSFNRRCADGTRYEVQLIAEDSSGIQTRKRGAPQYLAQLYKTQTRRCCGFEDTASERRWPNNRRCLTIRFRQ